MSFNPQFAFCKLVLNLIQDSKWFFLLTFLLLLSPSAVVHAQWEPERRLTFADGPSYTSLNNAWCIAASGNTVHIVWWDRRDTTNNYEIYYKRSSDGGTTWGSDVRFTDNYQYSWYPSIAVLDTIVHVVWDDIEPGNEEIYYKRSTDGGSTWEGNVRLTYERNVSEYPSVSVSDSIIHVVWDDTRINFEIYYKRSTDDGTTWGTDVRLTYDNSYSQFPSIASLGPNVHVVWKDYRDGNDEIYYKRSTDAGTTWGTDVRLTNDTSWSYYPSVAVSGSGVHLVWEDYRNGDWDIYYKRSTDAGSTWSPDIRLTTDSSASEFPSIAVSGTNVHVVWQDNRDGTYRETYYKHSSDGGQTWSPDVRLTNTPYGAYFASLVFSGINLHVVMQSSSEIYYKRNRTGNAGVEFSPPSRLTPHASRLTIWPNPFTSYATIPGHFSERFALYDISGRKVGTYKGDRIGEGLSPGVYFLRPDSRYPTPYTRVLRIVKIR